MRSNGSRRLWLFLVVIVAALLILLLRRRPGDGGDGGVPTPPPTAVVVVTVTPTDNRIPTATPTPEPTCVPTWATPGAHPVHVGQDPCDVKPWCVPIGATETVQWTLSNPTSGQQLWIEFPGSSPFPVVTQGPHGARVACTTTGCSSGGVVAPNPTPKPGAELGYKYWQIVVDQSGAQRACDGKIIIRW
jgi:hypothetical protein